ncbi:MAG: hypothetical protein ACFFAS_12135 [Promethearchaeota archaeon]
MPKKEKEEKDFFNDFGEEKFGEEKSESYIDYEKSLNAHFNKEKAPGYDDYMSQDYSKKKHEQDFEKSFENHFY